MVWIQVRQAAGYSSCIQAQYLAGTVQQGEALRVSQARSGIWSTGSKQASSYRECALWQFANIYELGRLATSCTGLLLLLGKIVGSKACSNKLGACSMCDTLQAPRKEPPLHPRVRRMLEADPHLAGLVKENPRLLRTLGLLVSCLRVTV